MPIDELLIVGSGAMGCLFAARMASLTRVTMLGTWQDGLAAIEGNGVRIQEPDGGESQVRVKVTSDPSSLARTSWALVLVKSWQTERAAEQLDGCLEERGQALTLQNGLGNLEILQAHLGIARASLGVTTTGATLLGPGYVRHGGEGPIYLSSQDRLDPIALLFEQAGFEVHRQVDLNPLIWTKLAVNAAINPLTALLNVPNGGLLEHEPSRAIMEAAAHEVAALANAQGIELKGDELTEFALEVAERTAVNLSSMLQDMRRNAPTEVDAICGAVARLAAEHNLTAPVNWTLWELVKVRVALIQGGSK